MTLTPRHRAVLGALGQLTGGMYLGSLKGRLGREFRSQTELEAILADLERVGRRGQGDIC